MNLVRLLPVFVSFWLLAAHFMRRGLLVLVILSLFMPVLVFFTSPRAARILQFALILAAAEWFRTLYVIAKVRVSMDMPWARLAIILGVVGLFTLASAFVFYMKPLKERYQLVKKQNQ